MESIKTSPSSSKLSNSTNHQFCVPKTPEMSKTDGRSPLTPLYPYAGRFNFSPSAINRLLSQDVMPTVMKKGQMAQRVFTPNKSHRVLITPSVSPILPDYKIPANSPANLRMPPPKTRVHLQQQLRGASAAKLTIKRPSVNLLNESGDSIINLISPMDRLDLKRTTPSGSSRIDTPQIQMMDSSFDAVVKASIKSQPKFSSKKVVNQAHLNEHISVSNVLDGINMSHLSPVFDREEIDLDVFTMMNSSDLASIGIVGDEQSAVLAAIKTFRE